MESKKKNNTKQTILYFEIKEIHINIQLSDVQ